MPEKDGEESLGTKILEKDALLRISPCADRFFIEMTKLRSWESVELKLEVMLKNKTAP